MKTEDDDEEKEHHSSFSIKVTLIFNYKYYLLSWNFAFVFYKYIY